MTPFPKHYDCWRPLLATTAAISSTSKISSNGVGFNWRREQLAQLQTSSSSTMTPRYAILNQTSDSWLISSEEPVGLDTCSLWTTDKAKAHLFLTYELATKACDHLARLGNAVQVVGL